MYKAMQVALRRPNVVKKRQELLAKPSLAAFGDADLDDDEAN